MGAHKSAVAPLLTILAIDRARRDSVDAPPFNGRSGVGLKYIHRRTMQGTVGPIAVCTDAARSDADPTIVIEIHDYNTDSPSRSKNQTPQKRIGGRRLDSSDSIRSAQAGAGVGGCATCVVRPCACVLRPPRCPTLHAFRCASPTPPSHPPTCWPQTTRAARDTASDALPLPTTNASGLYSYPLVPPALGAALWLVTPATGHDARDTNHLLGEVLRRHL